MHFLLGNPNFTPKKGQAQLVGLGPKRAQKTQKLEKIISTIFKET
jgi:hypothetical protein